MSEDNSKKITKIAAIATVIGTIIACCAAFAAFGNWLFPNVVKPSITITPVQIFNITHMPSTNSPQISTVTQEPSNTIIPTLEPDSRFIPSLYSIDKTFICESILNQVVECIKNELSITVTFPSSLGAKGIVSSPGYPSLAFDDLIIGKSIYYHNATIWYEIRFDDVSGPSLILHITSFRRK